MHFDHNSHMNTLIIRDLNVHSMVDFTNTLGQRKVICIHLVPVHQLPLVDTLIIRDLNIHSMVDFTNTLGQRKVICIHLVPVHQLPLVDTHPVTLKEGHKVHCDTPLTVQSLSSLSSCLGPSSWHWCVVPGSSRAVSSSPPRAGSWSGLDQPPCPHSVQRTPSPSSLCPHLTGCLGSGHRPVCGVCMCV